MRNSQPAPSGRTLVLGLGKSEWEAALVAALVARSPGQSTSGTREIRRCVDIADLLWQIEAAPGAVVVVDADFPRLDATAVTAAIARSERIVGLASNDHGIARLRRFGVVESLVVTPASVPQVAAVLAGEASADCGDTRTESGQAVPRSPVSEDRAVPSESQNLQQSGLMSPTQAGERLGDSVAAANQSATAMHERARETVEAAQMQVGDVAGSGRVVDLRDGRRQVATNRETGTESSDGTLVVVWGPPGAPGRTTIAIAMGQLLADGGRDVLLVDADTIAPGVGPALCLDGEASGLTAAVHHADRGQLDPAILARLARSIEPRFRVLTGLSHVSRRTELRAPAVSMLWDVASQLCGTTVIDIGGCVDDGSLAFEADAAEFGVKSGGFSAQVTALAAADSLVAVSSCEPFAIARLLSHVSAIGALAPSAELDVVINRVRTPVIKPAEEADLSAFIAQATGARSVTLVPEDRGIHDKATVRGLTPWEIDPRTDFVKAVRQVCDHALSPTLLTV